MARIKIKDLPKDMKVTGNELAAIRGGVKRGPTGIIIESGGILLESIQAFGAQARPAAPLSEGTGVNFGLALGIVKKR